jgi:sirohydrochlorin ferrochelatase
MKPAILVAGHGSRALEGTAAFHQWVELFAVRIPSRIVFPFFLFTGILEKRIRRLTLAFAAEHPETEFLCALR